MRLEYALQSGAARCMTKEQPRPGHVFSSTLSSAPLSKRSSLSNLEKTFFTPH